AAIPDQLREASLELLGVGDAEEAAARAADLPGVRTGELVPGDAEPRDLPASPTRRSSALELVNLASPGATSDVVVATQLDRPVRSEGHPHQRKPREKLVRRTLQGKPQLRNGHGQHRRTAGGVTGTTARRR